MVRPALVVLAILACVGSSCADDRVMLSRGPLGPAVYDVDLRVEGDPAVRGETVRATLEVVARPAGAELLLRFADEEPITAELRSSGGHLSLESVQGVSPGSAGETDLASLVGQLDPPLADRPVRLGDTWSSTRRIVTGSLEATLRSELEMVGFSRVGGVDAAELDGEVSGTLRTAGPSGIFAGRVRGETRIAWALGAGRVASSETRLVWTIEGAGSVVLRTVVRPA